MSGADPREANPLRLYFAAPLFCHGELDFNQHLTSRIEALGYQVFLPQRDGVESNRPPFDRMPKEERRHLMFQRDVSEIRTSDVFLIILDGRVPDEGACVELGIAFEKQSREGLPWIVGLQTDKRAAFLGSRLNPMIRQALGALVETEEDLLELLGNRQRPQALDQVDATPRP